MIKGKNGQKAPTRYLIALFSQFLVLDARCRVQAKRWTGQGRSRSWREFFLYISYLFAMFGQIL